MCARNCADRYEPISCAYNIVRLMAPKKCIIVFKYCKIYIIDIIFLHFLSTFIAQHSQGGQIGHVSPFESLKIYIKVPTCIRLSYPLLHSFHLLFCCNIILYTWLSGRPAKSTGLHSRLLGFFNPIYRSTGW